MDNNYNNVNTGDTNVTSLPENYKPNADELILLAQCRAESNMKGGITALISGGLVYQCIKSFKLSVNPKYGAWPKVGGAAMFGFFVGKLMAIPSCYEKFKNLPNSPIGNYIRQRKGGQGELLPMAAGVDPNLSFASIAPTKYKDDGPMNSALDIDFFSSPSSMDSHTGDEINESLAVNDNLPNQNNAETQSISYAELRRKNREEYAKADKERYNTATSITNDPSAGPPIRRSPQPIRVEEKNKYGDVWG